MTPIFEQGDAQGIGYNINQFHERFEKLCAEHLNSGRAQAFAFIFCNFTDIDLDRILKNLGAFARLDRLSGNRLTVFYLHANSENTTQYFNSRYINKLGMPGEVSLPSVVFFKMQDGRPDNIEVKPLDNADFIHGFHELYETIEGYIRANLT